jgi:hypothetical protein
MYLPDESQPPLSWYVEGGKLEYKNSKIFEFDFYNIDPSTATATAKTGSYNVGSMTVSWDVELQGGNLDDVFNRHDSVNHPNRGFFFDGRYDF